MDKTIRTHFHRADPRMVKLYQLLLDHNLGDISLSPKSPDSYFDHLCSAIVGQQLSDKAATTIYSRFVALFPNEQINPTVLIKLSHEQLRSVGVSNAKATYLHALAQAVEDSQIDLASLGHLSDDELTNQLTKIKGIGVWTAQMFMMFALGRPDIFSPLDLGLKKGIQRWYQPQQLTPKILDRITKPWSPYRTTASRILWKSLELPATVIL